MKKYINKIIALALVMIMTLTLMPLASGAQFSEANDTTIFITPGIITPGIVILDPSTIGCYIPVDTTDWPEPVASVVKQLDRKPVSKHSFKAFLEANNDWPEPVACVVEQLDRKPVSKYSFLAFLEFTNDQPKMPCSQEHLNLKE